MAVNAEALAPALCVDLDGTLIRSDVLLESFLLLLRRNALYLFAAIFWFLRGGKAALKAEIASRVTLNPAALPYNTELLSWLKAERSSGRSLWLCTAANERLANSVAQHLGLFDGVIASNSRINVAGERKADQLVERFGQRGFDYCGNEWRDLAIWNHAHGAIVVNAPVLLERQLQQQAQQQVGTGASLLIRTFPRKDRRFAAIVRALRPHQWAKNVLLLVPLLAAHQLGDLDALAHGILAVVAFSLCASSVYLLNDMLDLEADRAHPRKSKRPFAAGDLSLLAGFALVPALMISAALIAAFLPERFQLVLLSYYALTVAYSFVLKRMLLVDAVALAGLYTLRVIAGAGAAEVALSFWLLLFSVFLFLSLAFVKRYAELDALRRQQRLQAIGRGYHVEDLTVLQSLGTAAGYLSVLVLALYINSPDIQALYHRPKVIWSLCVLMLYWISRVWMTAHRGAMHDDPVVYALKDRVSLVVGLFAAISIAVAI
jgi:4-hydroxybenzoate polyprenyltransferase/phosphoserine phosphatase